MPMRFQSLDLNMGDNYVDKYRFDIRYFRGILLNLNEIDEDTDIFETHPEKFGSRILQVGFMDIN